MRGPHARGRLRGLPARPALARDAAGRTVVPADIPLLAIVLLWAFNFTAIRYAISHGFAPLSYAPLRWAIAALAF